MGLDKRTLKIVVIVLVVFLILGGITGLLLGLFLFPRYVELEVWPRSDDYKPEEPLIRFRTTDAGSWHPWVQKINDFLRAYETSVPEMPPRGPCSISRLEHGPRSQHCESVMRMWAPCTVDDFYGYPMGKPCVFLRLNHIHYWVPHPYNVSTSLPMPPEMPENLKLILRQRSTYQYGDHIWVSCDGEFSSDQENIGPIQYIPANMPPGFPIIKLHTADKLTRYEQSLPDRSPEPLIAVFFENPRRGVVINVECRIWSRDIYYDRSSRYGRARFEVYVE